MLQVLRRPHVLLVTLLVCNAIAAEVRPQRSSSNGPYQLSLPSSVWVKAAHWGGRELSWWTAAKQSPGTVLPTRPAGAAAVLGPPGRPHHSRGCLCDGGAAVW